MPQSCQLLFQHSDMYDFVLSLIKQLSTLSTEGLSRSDETVTSLSENCQIRRPELEVKTNSSHSIYLWINDVVGLTFSPSKPLGKLNLETPMIFGALQDEQIRLYH